MNKVCILNAKAAAGLFSRPSYRGSNARKKRAVLPTRACASSKKTLVDVCLADRGHVHHAALGPQVVETAGQVQFGARTEIGRPAFAVVADLLNDAI